ncbi:hypothetical protein CPB83DRAFT_853990 [Crepidotus variabilis]|uniref:Uncharacterized protein n=1 Tax=Crepidotus variabilis TaxID=179855 RepID=A0A9P6EGS8_9AGAR|nr:hypothetical protein CPB83DRAFT_853990 [Crepidotus variabilis]
MIKTRQRKLGHLTFDCLNIPDFDQAFGGHTKKAIMDLLPDLRSLSLNDIAVPAMFMEKLPSLQCFQLCNVELACQTSKSHVPPPIFTAASTVMADINSLEEIHRFYQRSQQPLPAYVNLTLDVSLPSQAPLTNLLSGSIQSLRAMTFGATSLLDPSNVQLEFGEFEKLTNIRLKRNTLVSQSGRSVLNLLNSCLAPAAAFLASASSPSNLVDVTVDIDIYGAVEKTDDWEETISVAKPIDELGSNRLLAQHPKLKSITIIIFASYIKVKSDQEQAEGNLPPVLEDVIGGYI